MNLNIKPLHKIDMMRNLSYYYKKRKVYDSAYYHYNKAYTYFSRSEHPRLTAQMLYNMSLIQGRYKNYAGSEVLIVKAIRAYENLKDYPSLYACYNHLALLQDDIGEYDREMNYYQKAMGFLDKIPNNKAYLYASLNNIGTLYISQGKYDKALKNFNLILKDQRLRQENRGHYARVLDNAAYCRFLKNDTLDVMGDFKKALAIRKEIGNMGGVTVSRIHLAKYYAHKKDSTKAIKNALAANKIAKNINNSSNYLESLTLLSNLDKENAKKYLQQYITYSDSLQQLERIVQNKFARIEFETDRYIEKNQLLSNQKIRILVVSFGMLVIVSLVYYVFIQRARHKNLLLEKEQQKASEQLYFLSLESQKNLERQKVNERNRISEELHDNILGRMTGIRLGMGSLGTEKEEIEHSRFEMFLDELQKAEFELRDISHRLSANFDHVPLGFSSLIEELIRGKSILGQFDYRLDIDGGIDWELVDGILKVNTFRVLQEAFQNILKHAGAHHVSVNIHILSGILKTKIKDDGGGFDQEVPHNGIGIKNMKSRIKKLNGKFHMISILGQGTKIEFCIPLKNK